MKSLGLFEYRIIVFNFFIHFQLLVPPNEGEHYIQIIYRKRGEEILSSERKDQIV